MALRGGNDHCEDGCLGVYSSLGSPVERVRRDDASATVHAKSVFCFMVQCIQIVSRWFFDWLPIQEMKMKRDNNGLVTI